MNIQITSQNSTTITAHHLTAMATKHINVCEVDFVTSSCDLHQVHNTKHTNIT
jgi:hypothetical protein